MSKGGALRTVCVNIFFSRNLDSTVSSCSPKRTELILPDFQYPPLLFGKIVNESFFEGKSTILSEFLTFGPFFLGCLLVEPRTTVRFEEWLYPGKEVINIRRGSCDDEVITIARCRSSVHKYDAIFVVLSLFFHTRRPHILDSPPLCRDIFELK